MNIVSQETTADNGAQQETLPEQDGDVNEDAGRPFATGRPGSQETSPNPYSDLIEVASQGVGMNQPSFQVILPVPEESPRPIIHIEIKKRSLPKTAYLTEQDPEKQKATRREQFLWKTRHACL